MNTNILLEIIDSDEASLYKIRKISEIQHALDGDGKRICLAINEHLDENALPITHEEPFRAGWTENCRDTVLETMKGLAIHSRNTYFRATCCESLFFVLHEKIYAEFALQAYETLAKSAMTNVEHRNVACFVAGVCRIFSRVNGVCFDFYSFSKTVCNYVKDHAQKMGWLTIHSMNSLYSCKQNKEIIISTLETLSAYYHEQEMYRVEVGVLQAARDIYKVEKNAKAGLITSKKLAIAYECMGDCSDISHISRISVAIDAYTKAITEWKKLKSEADLTVNITRVKHKLEKYEKLFADSMVTIKLEPIDISEQISKMKEHIGSASLVEAIWFLVYGIAKLESKETCEKYFDEHSDSFLSLLSKGLVDRKGRRIGTVPSMLNSTPEEKNLIYFDHARTNYQLSVHAFINQYLNMMREKFELNEDVLGFLVDSNVFVPRDRRKSFLKGLVAGFNLDYISAMSILMPQVENAIREMARNLDIMTDRFNDVGEQEYLSLGTIINRIEESGALEDKIVFNLRLFYINKLGFGMRDYVAHGLYSDEELDSSVASMAVWWFTLRLCCDYSAEFRKRLQKQNIN